MTLLLFVEQLALVNWAVGLYSNKENENIKTYLELTKCYLEHFYLFIQQIVNAYLLLLSLILIV